MIRYFLKIGDIIHYIEENNNELKTQTAKEKSQIFGINYFEAQQDYTADLEGLIQYRNDFNKDVKQIEKEINYKKYFNHDSAVYMVFKRFSSIAMKKIKFENIVYKEFVFFENCFNGGLQTFDTKYKDKKLQSYGYDFSGYYPTLLAQSDFKFPFEQGKRKKIKKINFNKLEYGIYKVKITCDSLDFKKIFAFNKNNLYTHYCLDFAYQNQETFNIKIELIIDDDYNCIYWKEDQLINSNIIFGDWFDYLKKIKNKYPKNKLVKKLTSSLWGYITKFKRQFIEEEFFDIDVSEIKDSTQTEYKLIAEKHYKDETKPNQVRTVYEIVKSENPYTDSMARLKPFFTSYCRTFMASLILSENVLEKVIRIHTDSVCLTTEHNFTHLPYYPVVELKTTGLINWKNVNKYEKEN